MKSCRETSFNLTESSHIINDGNEDPLFTLKNSVCMFTDQAPTPNIDEILDSNLHIRQQELFGVKSPRTVTFGHVEYMNDVRPLTSQDLSPNPRDALDKARNLIKYK